MTSNAEPYRLHRLVDRLVLVGVVAVPVLAHPEPWVWLTSFAVTFVALASSVLALAYLVPNPAPKNQTSREFT